MNLSIGLSFGSRRAGASGPAITGTAPVLAQTTTGGDLLDFVTWGSAVAPDGETLTGGSPVREMNINGAGWVAYVPTTTLVDLETAQIREIWAVVGDTVPARTFNSALRTTTYEFAPTFSTQPSFTASPVVGDTITFAEGVAGPDATLEIVTLTLGGVDKSGELVGLEWDTTGESTGQIAFQVSATNSKGTTLSNIVTDALSLPAIGTAPSIADGQAWIIDDGNAGIDASASGAGLTFEYAISGVPAGVTINTSTGLIDPNPTGIGSVGTGTATVTATDQFSRPITDTFTWSAALRPKAVVEGGIVLSFTEGVSFDPINLAFPITNGNTITYSIVGTQLPAAFSLSSGGILTEVSPPTVMADTAYILRGIDEYGYELSDTLNIEVLEISTVIAVNLAGDGTVNITRGDTGDFTITVSGSSTPSYNGTFTQDINGNPLNTALVEANAAIWFAPPVQTALTAIGSTHTLEAVGLYLFDGDAAAPTITTDWQNAGLSLGDTDATYVSQVTDGGDAITNAVTATRAGVTTTTAISNTIVVDAAPVAGSIFFSDNGNGTSTMDAFTPLAITLTDNGDGTSTTGGL